MKDNSDRSTIDILQEMAGIIRQVILLDTLEQLLQVAKDDDALKFLPLVKSIANYTSAQIAKDTFLQHKELTAILLSKVALLAELEGGSCDEQQMGS